MKRTAYYILIKKSAEERRSEERRKTDAPMESFVEKRNQAPQSAQEMAITTQPIRSVPLIALSPENLKFVELDKIISGSYYAKVQNRNTGEMMTFGTLVIVGEAAMNRKIRDVNEKTGSEIPLISENIPYHIQKRNIIPFNATKEHYALFNKLFYIARNCSEKECGRFGADNDVTHSEAVFVQNPSSEAFKRANYKLIIIKAAQLRIK